ncbi:MAG: ABC transporter ATP-binding protein, partial [Rhizobiaceae bacterium]
MTQDTAQGKNRTLMAQPILSVAGLSVAFRNDAGWQTVVRDISFDVAANETVALVGESGSGKSVTALSVMGLNAPTTSKVTGSIKLNGRDLLTLPENDYRKVRGNDVAMIFQEPMTSLNPVHTIGAQVAEALM